MRKLRVESLEPRALHGNLAVSVTGGTLVVTGDYKANGVTITPLAPTDQPAVSAVKGGSFVVTPDSTTSINRGKPGVPLTVSGATAGFRIDLGDGNDSLAMRGVPGVSLGMLTVQTGSGNDKVQISACNLSGVSVSSRGTLDFSMDQSACAGDMYLKIDSAFAATASSTKVQGSTIGGALTVSSQSADNVTLDGIKADSLAIFQKIDIRSRAAVTIKGESAVQHKLDVEAVGTLDCTFSGVSAGDFYLKLGGPDRPNVVDKTSLTGLTLSGGLTVASSVNQSLSISGIRGHKIELSNAAMSGRSSIAISDVNGDGELDVACTGGVDFTASGCTTAAMYLKFDGSPGMNVADKTNLAGLTLSGGLTVASSVNQNLSVSGIKAHKFELSNAARSGRSSIAIGDVNGDGELDVACTGGVDFTASGLNTASMYLKFDGSPGMNVADKTNLTGLTLSGGLTVASTVNQNLAISGIKVHKMDLSNSAMWGRSSFALTNVACDGSVTVTCAGGVDFSAGGGGLAGTPSGNYFRAVDMYLKFTDAVTGPASANVALTDLVLSGQLQVAGGGGNDTLSVVNASVQGPVRFAGGGGNDTLLLQGNRFASPVLAISWETTELKAG